jgi:hypothetical protein
MKNVKRMLKGTAGVLPEIESLDLTRIKWKLMDEEEGKGWYMELCDKAEEEYKKYLTLIKLFPEADIVPNRMMDQFWHQHILDTKAYADDCNKIFGQFIHHYPYFGMHGAEDKKNLMEAFEHTKSFYRITFLTEMEEAFASRCAGHACHKESSCACRTAGSCKQH